VKVEGYVFTLSCMRIAIAWKKEPHPSCPKIILFVLTFSDYWVMMTIIYELENDHG
jgi:hypothetical protein